MTRSRMSKGMKYENEYEFYNWEEHCQRMEGTKTLLNRVERRILDQCPEADPDSWIVKEYIMSLVSGDRIYVAGANYAEWLTVANCTVQEDGSGRVHTLDGQWYGSRGWWRDRFIVYRIPGESDQVTEDRAVAMRVLMEARNAYTELHREVHNFIKNAFDWREYKKVGLTPTQYGEIATLLQSHINANMREDNK